MTTMIFQPINKKMRLFLMILFVAVMPQCLVAQFHDSFTIHYTKKTNLHKQLGNDAWTEQIKKNIPKFVNDHFILTYKNGISFYKGIENPEDENSKIPEWIHSGVAGFEIIQFKDSFKSRKEYLEMRFQIIDTLFNLNWKIFPNERRTIAGFSCRKAVAKFNDSILIYAFYAEELMGSVGPELIHGLPGAILGMGIPQYNLTWFADKVEFHAKQFQSALVPKKKEKKYSLSSYRDEFKGLWGGRWDKRAEGEYWKRFF